MQLRLKNDELGILLKRVQSWPLGARKEAIRTLREIEIDAVVGPAVLNEVEQLHRQVLADDDGTEDLRFRLAC